MARYVYVMRPIRTLIQLAALISGLTGSAVLLLRVREESWLPPPDRILAAHPEEAIYGAVWLVASGITGWVAVTTVLSVLAHVTRIPAAVRATGWITIAPIQSLSRRVAVLMLAIGSLSVSAPAGAAQSPPVPHVVTAEHPLVGTDSAGAISVAPPAGAAVPIQVVSTDPDHRPSLRPSQETDRAAVPVPHLAGGGPGSSWKPEDGSVTYTVQPGDHLWSITAAYLDSHLGRTASVEEIAPLWHEVVEINRDTVVSGDPSLIFPGERIRLPDLRA